MPDIMILVKQVTSYFVHKVALLYKIPKSEREITQPNIYRILPKFSTVICSLHTICMPNIMILAQAVLQIFCSNSSLKVKCLSLKRE